MRLHGLVPVRVTRTLLHPHVRSAPRARCLCRPAAAGTQADASPTTTATPTTTSTTPTSTTTDINSSAVASAPSQPAPGSTAATLANIKAFGIAGTLSYVVTEIAFWAVALPGALIAYHQTSGQWLSWDTDWAQLMGLAAAFVTGVRFAVPLRMAAAMALVPSMQRLLQKSEER